MKLAEMPEIKQPTPAPKADEPKVLKPDIALPKDAIAGARKGKPTPLAQFTRTQKKDGKGAAQPADPGEAPMPGRTAWETRQGLAAQRPGRGGFGDGKPARRAHQESKVAHPCPAQCGRRRTRGSRPSRLAAPAAPRTGEEHRGSPQGKRGPGIALRHPQLFRSGRSARGESLFSAGESSRCAPANDQYQLAA